MASIQDLLKSCSQEIVIFLEKQLPEIGGNNWWQQTVVDNLTEMQLRTVEKKEISELSGFDLAAQLNIFEKNWRAITSNAKGLDYREGLNLIIGLKNIRNYYAHEPTSGTANDKKLRDVITINALLNIIGASIETLKQGQALQNMLMVEMVRQAGLNGAGSGGVPPQPTDEDNAEQHAAGVDGSASSSLDVQDGEGVPLAWLKANSILDKDILKKLDAATYVGIDFGTSTSVASIATVEENGNGLCTHPIDILQFDDLGREIHSYLVNTCLAWVNNKLLFGVGAAQLKQELVSGQAIWASFKMGLGVDLGPVYNRTALPNGKFEYTIEKPQHAAAIFLKLLCDAIRDYVNKNNLPQQIYYTVTVPASFQANQRHDLFDALKFAGIEESEIRLLDEPNAAFLSYLISMESKSSEDKRFVDLFINKKTNVIVFDFGAGTCDISILEVSTSKDAILSRNLGISKFWALGGDDIDKIIAEKILLPQLCGSDSVAKYMFTTTQLEQQVLPYLKPVAEALKIRCCEMAEQKNYSTVEQLRNAPEKISTTSGKSFTIQGTQGKTWQLNGPYILMSQFAEIMALFVGEDGEIEESERVCNVLQPIDNALEKIDLEKEDIDMVLFIGGSSENPIIRHYVSKHLGRFVECVVPRDLRAHVSQGAALYTLLLRGANVDPIRPIISETIYVLTAGGIQEPIIRAGTIVPSSGVLDGELKVIRDNQRIIELPFLSGSINKPLGIVNIKAPDGVFKQNEKVKITWSYSKEKILQVTAETSNAKQSADFLNPLVNEEVTEEVIAKLKAEQAFNQSVLDGNGRPSFAAVINYSNAARNAGNWRLAAEMLEAAERLSPGTNYATNICYFYSMDGDRKTSSRWSKTAYERSPNATTAYNYALDKWRAGDHNEYERLMAESLQHDPDYTATLVSYGSHLQGKGDVLGAEYLQRAYDIFNQEMSDGDLDSNDIDRFSRVARELGREDALKKINGHKSKIQKTKNKKSGFEEKNLVSSSRLLNSSEG